MSFVLAASMCFAGLASHCPEPVERIQPAEVCLVKGFTIGFFNALGRQSDVIEANDSLLRAFSCHRISDQEIRKTSPPPSGTWYGKSPPVRR